MNEPLTFEAFYPHPPERVWKALTDSSAIAQWLLPADFRPEIGFRFRLKGGRTAGIEGTVIEAEAPRRLSYTWFDEGEDGAAGTPSVVTWTLEPRPGGTHVRLEHAPPVSLVGREEHPVVRLEAGTNWRYAMYASLPVLLRLLAAEARRPPVPIVYMPDEPEVDSGRRAGFRQSDEAVRC